MDKGKTDTICQLDVCDDIFVTTQHFKGEILIQIRTYKQGGNGVRVPTKKGATIPIHRLKTFINAFKEPDDAIKRFKGDKEFNFRIDFGANWCVSLSIYPLINIRRWFRPENGALIPTTTGISLTFYQWIEMGDTVLFLRSDCITEQDEVLGFLDGRPLWNCSKCLSSDYF
jgi:hypothetical protein